MDGGDGGVGGWYPGDPGEDLVKVCVVTCSLQDGRTAELINFRKTDAGPRLDCEGSSIFYCRTGPTGLLDFSLQPMKILRFRML